MTADRWPVGVPRPLVATQEAMVREIGAVQSMPGHLVRLLAVLKCPKCSGRPVGDLRQLSLPDGPDLVRLWRGGTILTGTVQRNPDAVQVELGIVRQPGYKVRRVPYNDQYSALIDLPGLPAVLPFWCDRHQALTYPLLDLRAVAAKVEYDDAPKATVRVHH